MHYWVIVTRYLESCRQPRGNYAESRTTKSVFRCITRGEETPLMALMTTSAMSSALIHVLIDGGEFRGYGGGS